MSDEEPQNAASRMIITPEEFGKEIYEEVWREVVSPGITAANAPLREPRFNPPPRMLHYTSATGLEAILQTSILRLCRARASNDPMELEYGLDLARGIIREIQPANDVDHAFKRFIEAGTRDGTFGGRPRRVPEPHVCCFAASAGESDSIESSTAHWAMYGRNGAGFVLVFKGEALAQLALVDFLPVSYEPPEQRAKMERVIKIAKETTSAANDLARRKGIGDFQRYMRDASAHAFGSLLALHSAGMKGPRHGFEGEWRMMVSYIQVDPVGEQLPFEIQASGPVLRSYYERSFPKTALLEVIVGAKHYDLNEFVVAALLEKYGYSETKIRRGEVNIRGAEGT